MRLHLDQIDPRTAEAAAGWTTGGLRGAVAPAWPADVAAYRLAVSDDGGQVNARQAEVRRAVAGVVAAVARPGDLLVVRVDGPFGPGLLPALAAAAASDRSAVSPIQRLGGDAPPLVSVRCVLTPDRLDALCRDEQLALADGVRLRAFPLPVEAVDPMLDTVDPDDERWPALLPAAAGGVSTAADGLSVVIWTALAADPFRTRLAARLTAAA